MGSRAQRAFGRLLIILLAAGGIADACTKAKDVHHWTKEDRASANYYFRSQRDNREASRIISHAGEVLSIGEKEKVRNLTNSALGSARMVQDSFLDKANPHFREHYRKEFQRALELAQMNLESPNYDVAQKASDLFSAYADWYKENQADIHLPEVEK